MGNKFGLVFLAFLSISALFFPSIPECLADSMSIIEKVNTFRSARGLRRLESFNLLETAAEAYALEIAETGLFSHTDVSGKRAAERFKAFGGTSLKVGEVIGVGSSEEAVFQAWVRSDSHREVILAPRWSHIGVGEAEFKGRKMMVALFIDRPFSDMQATVTDDGCLITADMSHPETVEPVLLSGGKYYDPLNISEDRKYFEFFIPFKAPVYFLYLGYRSKGDIVLTDYLTLKIELK